MSDNQLRLLRAVDRLDATERLIDGMIDIALTITETGHYDAQSIHEIGMVVKRRMAKIRRAIDEARNAPSG